MTKPRRVASSGQHHAADPDAGETFYERYVSPLETRMLRAVWRIVHDEEMARDALQDALVRTWQRRERVRLHPNPEALILRICIHAAIDALRRDQRHRAQMETPLSLAARLKDGPTARLEARELRSQVLAAIGQLPTRQASAVLMRVLEERPYRAIAEALECAEATARIHVMRGRARLRRLLAHLASAPSHSGGEN